MRSDIPYKVGLTGGIGSGKSTVAGLFSKQGVPTFSADQISRELCQPKNAAYSQIVETFGLTILNKDGTLDRGALGDLIFKDPDKRKLLEHILHPMILQTMHQRADAVSFPYCVLDIPLLLNSAERERVDTILVVHCDREKRVQRIKKRSAWSDQKISRVMANQVSDEDLKAAANDWIDNSGKIDDIGPRVKALHAQYCSRATRG